MTAKKTARSKPTAQRNRDTPDTSLAPRGERAKLGGDLRDGVPRVIVEWVEALPSGGRAARHRARLGRFVAHWRQDATIERAWHTLHANAKSEDALISLFLTLPDGPANPDNPSEYQPLALVYGYRTALPSEEAARYRALSKQASELAEFLGAQRTDLRHLLADLRGTVDALPAKNVDEREALFALMEQLRGACGPALRKALTVLAQALAAADPFAKVRTKQANAANRAFTIYAAGVADLAQYLQKPVKWEALARIANVNWPLGKVTGEALRKQAARADKAN